MYSLRLVIKDRRNPQDRWVAEQVVVVVVVYDILYSTFSKFRLFLIRFFLVSLRRFEVIEVFEKYNTHTSRIMVHRVFPLCMIMWEMRVGF